MKVVQNEAWHICILCDDLPLVYGLWKLHLVNKRLNKLQKSIKKLKMVISLDIKV